MSVSISDSLKAFGSKAANVFRTPNKPKQTEQEDKIQVAETISKSKQEALEADFSIYKGKSLLVPYLHLIMIFIIIISYKTILASRKNSGDLSQMNKDLTSSLFHYQKISDAAELDNKERDEIAVSNLKKAEGRSSGKKM